MYKILLIKLGLCLGFFGFWLYSYIDKQNELTAIKIKIPSFEKQIHAIKEQTERLQYEIDFFENPVHLMEVARYPEFSHLNHPLVKDILTVKEGIALQENNNEAQKELSKPLFPARGGVK